MKALLWKLLGVAAFAALVASPAWAIDIGTFHLGHGIFVGGTEIPAGTYVFGASERGVIRVYNEDFSKVIAVALSTRKTLMLDEADKADTLAYDWTVREVSLGRFQYVFSPGRKPTALASRPEVPTTRIAAIR